MATICRVHVAWLVGLFPSDWPLFKASFIQRKRGRYQKHSILVKLFHDFDPHRKMRQKQFLHLRIQDSSTEDSLSLVKYGIKTSLSFSMKAQRRDGFAHAFDQSWNLQRKQIPPQKRTSWWHSNKLFCEKISSQNTGNLYTQKSQLFCRERGLLPSLQCRKRWSELRKRKHSELDVFFFSGFFQPQFFPAQYSNDQISAAKATQLTKMWENCQETLQKEALKKSKKHEKKPWKITWVRTLRSSQNRGQRRQWFFLCPVKVSKLGDWWNKLGWKMCFRQAKGTRGFRDILGYIGSIKSALSTASNFCLDIPIWYPRWFSASIIDTSTSLCIYIYRYIHCFQKYMWVYFACTPCIWVLYVFKRKRPWSSMWILLTIRSCQQVLVSASVVSYGQSQTRSSSKTGRWSMVDGLVSDLIPATWTT